MRSDTAAAHHVSPEAAIRRTIAGLRGCLEMAEHARSLGSLERSAGYILGALDDLAPSLAVLEALHPRNR
jgi:hypothetical protein